MKTTKYLIQFSLILILGITVGCKKEIIANDSNVVLEENRTLDGKWNLVNIYGGITGVNEVYATGEVIWTFSNNNLIVENNGANSSYFSLNTGTYQYDVIQANGSTYLVIDQSELGEFFISGNTMSINENLKSTGEGACGFYMELNR